MPSRGEPGRRRGPPDGEYDEGIDGSLPPLEDAAVKNAEIGAEAEEWTSAHEDEDCEKEKEHHIGEHSDDDDEDDGDDKGADVGAVWGRRAAMA